VTRGELEDGDGEGAEDGGADDIQGSGPGKCVALIFTLTPLGHGHARHFRCNVCAHPCSVSWRLRVPPFAV
jgi:hypothetical protein